MPSYIRSRKHAVSPTSARPALAATALATLAVPGALYAQQTLPEVKVQGTAEGEYKAETSANPKYVRPLSETPQTITVIKKEVMQEQGATTLTEALRNTPGVTMMMGENGNTATGDSVFMRGFDTQGSIFVDGIRDLGTYSRDTFNIDQVEVVKGSAGADIGRGNPSGYINMATKVPTLDNFSNGSFGISTAPWGRLTADLNRTMPGLGDGTAFRLNVMKQQGDVVGRDHVTNDAWGVAPSVAFGLGTPTRVYAYALHVERDRVPEGGLPTIGLPGFYNAALANAGVTGARVDTSNFYGSRDDFDRVDLDQFTFRVEHDLRPGLTVRNITRYGEAKQKYVLTGVNTITATNVANPASWTVSRSRQGKDQRNEVLTNQTNVTAAFATGAVKHTMTGGVEFIYEKQTNNTMAAVGTQGAANLYNPSTADVFVPVGPNGARTRGDTTTIGLYVGDTVDVTDRIQLSGGLRFDKYRTEYLGLPATGVANPVTTSLEKSDNLFTYKLGALYKLAPNGNIYAAYGYAEKPPGGDNFTLAAATPNATTGIVNSNAPTLDPQESTNIELGTKWDLLGNKLAVTAALFRTENRNEVAEADAVTGEVFQYGKRRVQGLELGAVGQITPAWQLSAGAAWMDTEVTQASSASPQQQGAAINWSPKFSFTLWTTYKLPMGLTIGGGARYLTSQKRQVSTAATATINTPEVPSYTVFDAYAAYEVSKNFSLQLNVYNLTDKFYLASLNNGGSRYTLGTPRSAMLTANLKF